MVRPTWIPSADEHNVALAEAVEGKWLIPPWQRKSHDVVLEQSAVWSSLQAEQGRALFLESNDSSLLLLFCGMLQLTAVSVW